MRLVSCFVLPLVLLAAAGAAAGQGFTARDVGPALATREQLQQALVRARQDSHAGAVVTLLRTRLDSGDFEPGDRIFVRVQGERELTDTFAVGEGPMLGLPQLGAVPLAGVLRSELQHRLEQHLARYVRDPVVEARPLIRILVDGSVAKPGFYAVAPEVPLADVMGIAGGLLPQAKVAGMRVERGGAEIWSGAPLQQALGRGASLDQLNLRAGDRVVVPAGRVGGDRAFQILGLLVSVTAAAFTISRIH